MNDFPIKFKKQSSGGYHAYCPALKGCHSEGDSFKEAQNNIKEAISLYLESLKVHKEHPPFITLHQPKKGYRYTIDSFLLARFAKFKSSDTVCDLGAGVGILGLLALDRYHVKKVCAVEIQKELAELAKQNAEKLGYEKQFIVYVESWRKFAKHKPVEKFDVVISNPPYRKLTTGKIPPHHSKAVAKHEIKGNLKNLLQATKILLKTAGRFYVIYPILRFEELLKGLNQIKMKAERIAMIHPYAHQAATHVMVEAVKAPYRELKVEAPVIVYRDTQYYQPEIEAWVGRK